EPDGAGEGIVRELDEERREGVAGVVIRARDPERIAQAEAEDLVGEPERHVQTGSPAATVGRASTARSISAHSGPGPKRTGSSTGRPVSAATRAISARAASSSGMDHVLSAIATTLDGATSPATRSWSVMNGRRSAMGTETSGRWWKSCSVWPALWTRTIAWGVAPWMSASVTEE